LQVIPGETALAFYTAQNPTDEPVVGISTYNVVPFEAGQYFNKIQCFCFEEQMLNPHEEVRFIPFIYMKLMLFVVVFSYNVWMYALSRWTCLYFFTLIQLMLMTQIWKPLTP